MRILVVSNDVVPGFGVPVAAPGLRAAGLAEGFRAHGHQVSVSVPSGVIDGLFSSRPQPPEDTAIVDPRSLMAHIDEITADVVVFSNANVTPHLAPIDGVRFVYDMFAPKMLETLASTTQSRPWQEQAFEKERALALADLFLVNGQRKVGYMLGWLLRPAVDAIRQTTFNQSSLVDDDLLARIHVVEMAVPLPDEISVTAMATDEAGGVRLGVAGYSQRWSALDTIHPAHEILIAAGHELHALLPAHWGGPAEHAPANQLPVAAVRHEGPLDFADFCRWVQSMHVMVDVFAPSPERQFAMITRSVVALRLGVPVVHGVDSEVSDIIREYDAGWVVDPLDRTAWAAVAEELSNPTIRARKRAGAQRASVDRFAPAAALEAVSHVLASW